MAAITRLERRALLRLALGAAIPLAVLLIYQKLCFGGFLTTSIALENPVFLDGGKLAGVLGLPSAAVFSANLVSPCRGLLLYCPVLAFVLLGVILAWKDGHRALVAASVSAIVAVHILAASFNGWRAGWSTGPRYLIVAIPFWCLLLPDLGRLRRFVRYAYLAAMALSSLNMIAIAAVEVMATDASPNPLYGMVYREFFAGQYPLSRHAHNAGGDMFRLPPLWDLLPLALLIAVWLAWCAWARRRHVGQTKAAAK